MSMKKMLAVVAAASLVAVAAPAFAANPFSDVPMNHWAYDAVEQLAAKGILDGYPNGTFKGNRAMTRYEIATMVARMMANGVGGADADKLKALIVEFAPELEALGVKVDGFDGRLSALEKGVGGWKIWGQMRFDYTNRKAKNWDKDNGYAEEPSKTHGFQFNRARLFLHKDLTDGVSFEARWHGGKFDRYWVTAKDFLGAKGLQFRAGQFYVDWEGPDNLYQNNHYWDDDANFLDGTVRGVELQYKRGGLELAGLAASDAHAELYNASVGDEIYGARLKYGAEKFFVSANFLMFNGLGTGETKYTADGTEVTSKWQGKDKDTHFKAYWFALGFRPLKGLTLNGAYYIEKIETLKKVKPDVDDPKAWKVVLDVDQSVLKFTSLRGEFGKWDEGFFVQNGTGAMSWNTNYDLSAAGAAFAKDTKWLKVSAVQNWGAKFATYERFAQYDQDDNGKAKEMQFGIHYKYSPNLGFMVDYTKLDGALKSGTVRSECEDKVIRFRTFLAF